MSIEALKEAKSVIGSINSGKANALTIGAETVYWQREEWVRWALDEVLPQLEKAIDAAEKQEPFAYYFEEKGYSFKEERTNSWFVKCPCDGKLNGIEGLKLYDHPQPKQEPVAYTTGHCKEKAQPNGCRLHNLHCGYPACDRKAVVTPQPKREPLTDEQCLDLAEGCTAQYHDLLALCRAIEAAHGIKENT